MSQKDGREGPAGTDAAALLAEGLRRHRAGRLSEAAGFYGRVLAASPDHADALNLLGVARLQMGNAAEAAGLIGRAVGLKADDAGYLNNLGEAYRALGRLKDAADCYRRAIELNPGDAAPHNNLGNALAGLGRPADAVASYRRALDIEPNDPETLDNLGEVLAQQGNHQEAVACFRRAVAAEPNNAAANINLGAALCVVGDVAGAAAALRRAVAVDPTNVEALNGLGAADRELGDLDAARKAFEGAVALAPKSVEGLLSLGGVLRQLEKPEEAIACYRRALEIDPENARAYNHLGNAYKDRDDLKAAEVCYHRALALDPESAEAYLNLGNVFHLLGRFEDAIAAFRRSVACDPDYAHGHFGLGHLLLLLGRFREGWPEYAWRRLTEDHLRKRKFSQPEWKGENLSGRTILVWSEQGVGDEIMFSTCLPDLLETAKPAKCVLECDSRLIGIFRRTFPELTVIPRPPKGGPNIDKSCPSFDVQVPIGGLPGYYRRDADDFPDKIVNLVPDPKRTASWRSRLDALGDGLKVGIAWRGGFKSEIKARRSIPVADLRPLLAVEGVRFVNLQYGDCEDELHAIEKETGIRVHQWPDTDPLKNLEVQAAEIACLDLVVQASNASAHLAGALGVPVWNLVPFPPDPRWQLDRADSPWYPSMRLFRQHKRGDWSGAVGDAARALDQLRRVRPVGGGS